MAEQAIFLGPQDVIGAALIKRAQRDEAFRAELIRDPHTVVERELGLLLPDRLRLEIEVEQPGPRLLATSCSTAVAVPA